MEPSTTVIVEQQPQGQLPRATDPIINIRNCKLLDRIDNVMRDCHDGPASKPRPQTAKGDLVEYAAQSDEDRAKALDNLICECIQDESFVTLMEDVEGAWKRIGLGF